MNGKWRIKKMDASFRGWELGLMDPVRRDRKLL
jgi:hypothetical protein